MRQRLFLWSVDWETHVRQERGESRVEIQEKGNGKPWKYRQPITWQKTMVFSTPQPNLMQVESVRGQRRDTDGNLLSEMDVRMDPQAGRVLYLDARQGEKTKPSVLLWKPEILPDEKS